jgi:hypothetical protein
VWSQSPDWTQAVYVILGTSDRSHEERKMKLKDFCETGARKHKIWPPKWGAQEVQRGREHPNIRREEFARLAIIECAVVLRDQCGVLLNVSHPEYSGRVSGTLCFLAETAKNRTLAKNLVKVAELFRGKTVEELGEAEVNGY